MVDFKLKPKFKFNNLEGQLNIIAQDFLLALIWVKARESCSSLNEVSEKEREVLYKFLKIEPNPHGGFYYVDIAGVNFGDEELKELKESLSKNYILC